MSDNDDDKSKSTRDPEKEQHIRREARRQRAIERLGSKTPKCTLCPETDPLVLELHHLEGKEFGNTLVPVCRNCHRRLSDLQKDHPKKIADPPSSPEATAHLLLGLADLFEFLIKKMREYASRLMADADPNRDNLEPRQ